jgi:hypothetical protein
MAISPKKTSVQVNRSGRCRLSANRPKQRPPPISVASTKAFLVRNISTSGPHRGLIAQGMATRLVKNAISASLKPRLLYMSTATTFTITKGKPSAV